MGDILEFLRYKSMDAHSALRECRGINGGYRGEQMIVCRVVVPKAPPNDRVRAEGPNEKPSAGARMKRA